MKTQLTRRDLMRLGSCLVPAWIGTSARATGWRSMPPLAAFEYDPYEPHELALQADWIPVGTIREVWRKTFVIAVDEWVVGPDDPPATLEVWRFEDWTCAGRWAPYEVGQRALLHLREPEPLETEHPYVERPHPRVMGGGNEGECPLLDPEEHQLFHMAGSLSFRYGEDDRLVGTRSERIDVGRRALFGTRVDVDVYGKAVRGLRRTFRSEQPPHDGKAPVKYQRDRIVPLVDYDGIRAYAKTSWLAVVLTRWVLHDDAYRPHPSEPGRPR